MLDLGTKTISSVHPLAFTVTGIAVSPDGARLFVARTGRLGSDVVDVHLASAEIKSIPVAARGASSIDVIRIGTTGGCTRAYPVTATVNSLSSTVPGDMSSRPCGSGRLSATSH